MAARAFGSLIAATAIGCVALGCTPDREPASEVVEEDENLVLWAPPGEPVCAGTFARGSAEVDLIRAEFRPSDGPIDYVWMPEHQVSDEDFPCFPTLSDYACAQETTVYARTLASTHELVHAARAPNLPRLLEEGLATMLEEPKPNAQELAPRAAFADALMGGTWSGDHADYERAGHFMSFLVAWQGRAALRELEDWLATETDDSPAASPTQLSEAMLAVYGADLSGVLSEYESYPDCAPAQFHQPITECELLASSEPSETTLIPSFLDESDEDELLMSIDCADSSVYGPVIRVGEWTNATAIKLDVDPPFATTVIMELQGEIGPGATAWLSNCGDCWSGSGVLVSEDEPLNSANLQSGPHILTMHQALDDPGELGIELRY